MALALRLKDDVVGLSVYEERGVLAVRCRSSPEPRSTENLFELLGPGLSLRILAKQWRWALANYPEGLGVGRGGQHFRRYYRQIRERP